MLLLMHVAEDLIGVPYMKLWPQFLLPPYPPLFWLDGRLPTVISCLTKNEYLDHYCTSS